MKTTAKNTKSRAATQVGNIHPGEVLVEEFLKPMGISQYRLGVVARLSHSRITDLVKGRRGVTIDTALRLSRVFGTTPELWLNLQRHYDLTEARQSRGKEYDAIGLIAGTP